MLYAVIPFSPEPAFAKNLAEVEVQVCKAYGPTAYFISCSGTKETRSDLQGNMNDLKTELRGDMEELKKPMRRIERMLWSIIGAAALILLLFDDEILAFVRNLLSSQQ